MQATSTFQTAAISAVLALCAADLGFAGPPPGLGDLRAATASRLTLPALAPALGATPDWADNLDSYPTGAGLHGEGGWTGWLNDPSYDASTSDSVARSLPNAVDIVGDSDLVQEFAGHSAGQWVFSAWQYIPSPLQNLAALALLDRYSPDPDCGCIHWGAILFFAGAEDKVVGTGSSEGMLPIVYDQWVEVRVEIDLDADTQRVSYGGQLLYSGSWSAEHGPGGVTEIAALNLWSGGSSSIYYDDISLTAVPPAGQVQLPLAFNFNGIVHPGERDQPDVEDGFRSIADRALSLLDCDGAEGPLLPTAVHGNTGLGYALEANAGALDMIHLGNRNTVSGSAWAFDAEPDGDSVGITPTWLADPDQTEVHVPVDNLLLEQDFVLGVLYHASDGGGTFDLTLEFGGGTEHTVVLDAADWFAPAGGVPDPPGPGVALQANLGSGWCSGDAIDRALAGPQLLLHEAVVTAATLGSAQGELGTNRILTGLRFSNRSNLNAGYGIYAVTVTADGLVFADGFETGSTGMWSTSVP